MVTKKIHTETRFTRMRRATTDESIKTTLYAPLGGPVGNLYDTVSK